MEGEKEVVEQAIEQAATAQNDAEAQTEQAAETVESAIDAANERAEQAAETAERIAESAMEGERARRLEAIEERFDNRCQTLETRQAETQQEVSQVAQALAPIQAGLTHLTGLIEGIAAASAPAQQSSTPPNTQAATEQPQEQMPQNVAEESPVQETKQSRRRFL